MSSSSSVHAGGDTGVVLPQSVYLIPPQDTGDQPHQGLSTSAPIYTNWTSKTWISAEGNGTQQAIFIGSFHPSPGRHIDVVEAEGDEVDTDLLRVTGLRRLKLLLKVDPISAGSLVAGIIGCAYLIARIFMFTWPIIYSLLLSVAYAQNSAAQGSTAVPVGRDSFDWLIASLMGLVLLVAVAAALFCKEQKKVTFGMDTTKTIVGFLIGFLSGGRGRA